MITDEKPSTANVSVYTCPVFLPMTTKEERALRVNIIAMMSIGKEILKQLDKNEKPPTKKQSRALDMDAKIQYQMTRKRKVKA